MRRSSLSHELRLLLEACAVAAMLVLPACKVEQGWGDCPPFWEAVFEQQLNTAGTLVSLTYDANQEFGERLVLLREGMLVHVAGNTETVETIPATDLRAWAELSNGKIAVGDGGQVARSSFDEWALVDVGISDDLLDVVASRADTWALAITSDRVLYSSDGGSSWTELPAPAGGGFRRVFARGEANEIWLIGDDGRAWRTSDPSSGEWEAMELGTDDDLTDGVELDWSSSDVAIISAETLHVGADQQWTTIPVPEGESFVAVDRGYVVTDRALYQIDRSSSSLAKVAELDFTPVAVAGVGEEVHVAGSGGELVAMSYWPGGCLGRPWLVDGVPTIASLQGMTIDDGWARDGLFEHASVASFARFVTELLALAAPPALIRAAQAAILDELEHTRLCFELAAREHAFVRPGPLPLDPSTAARAGDPVALALAVFEEGCLGESIAAIEAGIAAAEREDPEVRRVLERIAADERRHAALAWRTLRWLMDEFGTPVRAALASRITQLDRGVAELVGPLATALLAAPG